MMFELPKGFSVGNCDNGKSGVTVILADGEGAVGGADVRGGAPGTREISLLSPEKAMQYVNAVVLTGGSAFGLETACGVMKYLLNKGVGYKIQDKIVPIVPAAVLYDLSGEGYDYPDAAMGIKACEAAKQHGIALGSAGAGKGATVGKIRGPQFASKGGLGGATVSVGGVNVTAIIAVNAFGDVYDYRQNKIIAGAKDNDGKFLDMTECILTNNFPRLMMGANTTIGCIMTDAKLTKLEANKLARAAHNGLVKSISPVHTDYDGDTIFALSKGDKQADFTMLCVAAVEAVALAVIDAVRQR